MARSIRTRMIVAMNLLVVGVGAAVGWVGIQVAGAAIEYRLIDQAASNAAGLAGEMRLPLRSAELMLRMGRILGAEVAAGPGEGTAIAASSLPADEQAELAAAVGQKNPARRVTLHGVSYRIGSARLARAGGGGGPIPGPTQLYVLVPETQVNAAKREAALRIAALTAVAIVLATGVAIWLSTTIARPVRRLAARMDTVEAPSEANEAAAPPPPAEAGTSPVKGEEGPAEIERLERSFEGLLKRLGEAQTQLARSARLATLGQLAASVAHELRNPLSGIKMNARVLADELKRAGIADQSLELIIREIGRMDLYLEELLDLSSTAANSGGPAAAAPAAAKMEPVDLGELAESVLALLAGRCRHGQVEVERRFEAGNTVRGDASHLRQVMLNLMLNALEAMPHGGRMTIATATATDGGAVRFSVADSGGGVRGPAGADIFDPFVTTKPDGTGLGLAVCRQIIARHGGRIGYDTAANGSVFWFELSVQ
ncbi:MAG: HAMP domain-containing sensor histidine kinase [Phycisphaerae bacterium]|nr:HAMP domain-containing sensor histidine kinase [Phycisphaerae bacterium]